MFLKKFIPLLLLFYYVPVKAQESKPSSNSNYSFIGLGYSLGKIIPSLSIFPDSKQQQSFDLTYGISTYGDNNLWAKHLNYPKTGLMFSYSDFGNPKQLGVGLTLMPFFDCGVFDSFTKRIRFQAGLGGSYTTVIFDKVTNPGNYGITTHITWAFRVFMYYSLIQTKDYAIKIGAGLTHFSNGHTRLPNHGLNSALATIKTELYFPKTQAPILVNKLAETNNGRDVQNYFSTRFGIGIKVLSRNYDAQKGVLTSSFSFGKIKHKTYKYGLGLYYHFYEDYYDYIKEDGQIINDKFPNFKKAPIQYSSALGIFSNFEILMNHISLEAELGVNLYKPAYKMDWQLNDGLTYYPREFGVKDKFKNVISTRLGLRYYALNTKKSPLHNLFLATNINANLGQADFSELSFGYVYSPKAAKSKN
ncbi:MAG: acyloxyacyl hydrolase [Flavobacterium sp.]|uniref:acyloxyacyl hydrolase n=1 Tax=Flavobacterium sp. TaxID=239 RepID=UPI002602E22D|nr:acyloxyacyl hydrolase [Flavobacterium sp.]MDD5149150.1 acyloxyacyl hydrolase [Flavobacterium sp.]